MFSYLLFTSYIITSLSLILSYFLDKAYVSIKFVNYIRLFSCIISGCIVLYIIMNHIIIGVVHSYNTYHVINGIVLSLIFYIMYIRWDMRCAPVFISTIVSLPISLYTLYIGNYEFIQSSGPILLLNLSYTFAMLILMSFDHYYIKTSKFIIDHISPNLRFIDPLIDPIQNKELLVKGITSSTILGLLNFIDMISSPYETNVSVVFILTLFLFMYTIIGIRLLDVMQNVTYPYSFVFDIVQNIIRNITIVMNQIQMNTKPTPNIYVMCYVVLMSFSFVSTSIAAPPETPNSPAGIFPDSSFSSNSDTSPFSNDGNGGPVCEGSSISKLNKTVIKTVENVSEQASPHVKDTFNRVHEKVKDAPAVAAYGLIAGSVVSYYNDCYVYYKDMFSQHNSIESGNVESNNASSSSTSQNCDSDSEQIVQSINNMLHEKDLLINELKDQKLSLEKTVSDSACENNALKKSLSDLQKELAAKK